MKTLFQVALLGLTLSLSSCASWTGGCCSKEKKERCSGDQCEMKKKSKCCSEKDAKKDEAKEAASKS